MALEGRACEWWLKRAIMFSVASSADRSGRTCPSAFSIAGMNSMRGKGVEMRLSSNFGRDLSGESWRVLTRFARPLKRSSVMFMRVSRSAKDL